MSTHIGAAEGQVAESILLPGDPLRAKFIAETFFERPERFNEVRNMFGYTGLYKGHRVSAMGTGMGIPSISIYVTELVRDYGVKRLVRVGTCGGMQREVKIRDLVLAMASSTNSSVNRQRFKGMDYAAAASFELLLAARNAASARGLSPAIGNVLSTDVFYNDDPDIWRLWAAYGVLGVDMESSELYTIAAKHRVEALSILTVSDHLVTGESTSSEEREKRFMTMAEIGLEALFGK